MPTKWIAPACEPAGTATGDPVPIQAPAAEHRPSLGTQLDAIALAVGEVDAVAAVTLLASADDSWCASGEEHAERVAYLVGVTARLAAEARRIVLRAQVEMVDAAEVPAGEKW